MLKSIKIKNFESHKNSKINLSPGINIIIGDNDSGKSALLRSLEQIALNPIGDDYRSNFANGKEETEIEIITDKDEIIKRIRSKNKNQYQIGNNQPLEAFGRGKVPDEISTILSIENINIQPQKEPAFLLTSNSGQIAKYLNQIVNLEEIDGSLSFIKKKKKTINHNIELLETENLVELEKELEQYSNLETWESKLKEVEGYENQCKKLESTYEKGISLLDELDGLQSKLAEDKRIIQYKSEVSTLLSYSKNSSDLSVKIQKAFCLIVELHKQNKYKEKYKNILQHKKGVASLVELYKNQKSLGDKIEKVEKRLYNLKTEEKRKKDLISLIKTKKTELDKIMPDICPLCGK